MSRDNTADLENEYVTLTVVVRRHGITGDPCDTVLGEHSDVLFVGHEDGITHGARLLGADPTSWI